MTAKQIGMVRGMMAKLGCDERDKMSLAMTYSNHRAHHLTEMTQFETKKLVDYLRLCLNQPDTSTKPVEKTSRQKMVGKLLSGAHRMLWYVPGKGKMLDMNRVNQWCLNHTRAKKRLDDMSEDDLRHAVTGMEMTVNSFLKGV